MKVSALQVAFGFFKIKARADQLYAQWELFLIPMFGGFMFASLMMSYFLYWQAASRQVKILLGAAIFFQVVTLFLTFSRSALFAYLIANVIWFYFVFRKKETRQNARSLLILVVGSLLLTVLLFFPMLRDRGGVINYNEVSQCSDQG